MILAGDIGGTKTLLACFDPQAAVLEPLQLRSYPSQQHASLEAVLDLYLKEIPGEVQAACFGIAGPVVDQRSSLTNLAWNIDRSALQQHLGIAAVALLNDLESIGHSLSALPAHQLHALNAGTPRAGNRAVIAAGTGLGECLLFWDGERHHPSPTEGGHCDFGPRDRWERGLLEFLADRYEGHVSYERILSGQGFVDLFDYQCSVGGMPAQSILSARATHEDPAPAISQAGLDRSCAVCAEVVGRFIGIYGGEAGNLALKSLAVGGIYVGGGIAPRLLERMVEGGFMRGFLDKGRFRGLLEQVPVQVILNERAGLLGAANFARGLLA